MTFSRNDLRGNKNYFELAEGSSYRESTVALIENCVEFCSYFCSYSACWLFQCNSLDHDCWHSLLTLYRKAHAAIQKPSRIYTAFVHAKRAVIRCDFCQARKAVRLTNQPQFYMVYTDSLIDHRNDVIKCSKLEWNQEPQSSGFTAKF